LKQEGDVGPRESDLNEIVETILRVLKPVAKERGIQLSACRESRRLPVRAERVRLEQVILNLAMNGMDAMADCPPGERRLLLETMLKSDSTVEASVSDSGPGVPDDKLDDIFDTFYTTKRQGTGLGLSIARTIIQIYGGRIWAENRTVGGAVFRFTLPLSGVHSG
jgi:signal transduction histidine kinase